MTITSSHRLCTTPMTYYFTGLRGYDAAVMITARRVALAAQKAFPSAGLTLLQANGAEGGQTVNHFHMHVVPRHADDGIALSWPRKEPAPTVLADYAQRLKDAL